MTQIKKTETELAEEVAFLRRRVAELESREPRHSGTGRETASGGDRLHAILRAFDGYIYVCSRDFRVEYMNDPLIRRTGYDATGDLCYKALHDRDDVCPWCVNDRVFNGETVRWQVQSPKDGRWYDVINTPYYNGDGGVCKQSMMIDVTELKQAAAELRQSNERLERMVAERAAELLVKNRRLKEEIQRQDRTEQALRESEEKYRSLVEHIGIGVSLISPSMEILTLNRQMRQWLPHMDFSKSTKCFEVFNDPARDGICAYCPTIRTLNDGQVHEAVTDTPMGGEIRHFRIVSSPIRDEDGKVAAAIEMVEDVTERKKLQERLRLSEASYRTIFETTGTATMVVEKDNAISLVNTEFERLSGFAKAEIEGRKTWRDFIAERDRERMQTYHLLRRVDPDKAPRNYECRFVDRQGRVREVFVTVAMQPGTAKSMVSFLDITERKRAEEALRTSERKLRLLSSRLLHTQEEERKRIAGDLHDSIGQSLLLIKMKAESALQRNKRRGTKAQLVDAMNDLVPTIQDTVEEVRRICTGLRPSLLDDLGLVTTIGWCCRDFQANCPDIAIEQAIGIREDEIPESLKIVIFRIVQEALNNAAKYSRAEWVTLSLVRDGGAVALALTDDGVGFDLDRVASVDSRVRGLGISGMRERTELSGGRFSIVSAVGRGTQIRARWETSAFRSCI